jgi:lipopolysaccharide/colanic/teichoic acid biosynthesis glycosyltransferase
MEPAAVAQHYDPTPVDTSAPLEQARATTAVEADAAGWAGPRRALNVVAASILLIVTSPLWLLIAAAIKLTSRGPVLYAQVRVGIDQRIGSARVNDPRRRHDLGGRPFTMYKFRTMKVDAERGTGAVWAMADDPRVTAVGRWLRQFRMDELPQLINVLKGDMNLVGPRPERPTIVEQLRKEIPHYQVRQRALPGITGHAQVNLEYDSSVDDVRRKVEHDLEYIDRASAWEDLKIMVKTIPVMLFRRGSR